MITQYTIDRIKSKCSQFSEFHSKYLTYIWVEFALIVSYLKLFLLQGVGGHLQHSQKVVCLGLVDLLDQQPREVFRGQFLKNSNYRLKYYER